MISTTQKNRVQINTVPMSFTPKDKPQKTGYLDKNGQDIYFRSIVSQGLIDKTFYYVIQDATLGTCIAPIWSWKKEKLTDKIARILTVVNV